MKKLLFILTLILSVQVMSQNKFETQWKEIETQLDKGDYKSLLPKVESIFNEAKRQKDFQNVYKSLLIKSKIATRISDKQDLELEVYKEFTNEIDKAKTVEKSILQSALAELLIDYLAQNYWDISDRTNLDTEARTTEDDFRFWTESEFIEKISALLENSIQPKKDLQKENLKNYQYILVFEKNVDNYQTSLYDLLVHRYINFLNNQSLYYYFGANRNLNIENKDEIITNLYQELISFHQNNKEYDAELYNEFQLLKFQNTNKKEQLPKIDQLAQRYPQADFTTNLKFEKAKILDDLERRKEALDLANSLLQKDSKIKSAIEGLRDAILAPSFDIQIENFLIPDQFNPIQITHRNVDQLHFKVLKYNYKKQDLLRDFNLADSKDKQAKLNELLQKFKVAAEFKINLNHFEDYLPHATTYKFEKLQPGLYLILVSNKKDFDLKQTDFVLNHAYINVTNYTIAIRNDELLLTHRNTGEFIPNQTIVASTKEDFVDSFSIKTNDLGIAKININKNRDYLYYKINNEDIVYNGYFSEIYKNTNKDRISTISKTFTDRAIYRPGQIVYFKTIVFDQKSDNTKQVKKNQNVEIKLLDPNLKVIATQQMTTNDFGSVSGQFVLPISGLTGQFSIQTSYDSDYWYAYKFSVEEYKRPKFEVKFDEVKETFTLDKDAKITGQAQAYSGANIDNAKVSYRVYRQAKFPYRPWWMKIDMGDSEPQEEITFGETQTDAQGKFEIIFNAKSGEKYEKGEPRTYVYRVEVDITDVNGETRSNSNSITIGDLPFTIEIPIREEISLDEFAKVELKTQNLNHQEIAAKGNFTIEKLIAPDRVLRTSPLYNLSGKYYDLISEQEFKQIFPNEPYKNELDKMNWKKDKPIVQTQFNTQNSKEIKLENTKNWEEGYYIIRAWNTENQDTILTEKLVYLYKNVKTKPSDNKLYIAHLTKNSYQPGETLQLQIASAAQNAKVLVEVEMDGELLHREIISLNNNVKNFTYKIEEKHRGNFFIHTYFGKFNTVESEVFPVEVPYKDESLKITTSTLRDKLLPGQNETWELTISGPNKDKFLSETLATMYDASLDQFRSNSIAYPNYKATRYPQFGQWNTYNSFGKKNLTRSYAPQIKSKNYDIHLYGLNLFGFAFNSYQHFNYFYKASPVVSDNIALEGRVAGLEIKEKSNNVVIRGVSSNRTKNDTIAYGEEVSEDGVTLNEDIELQNENVTNVFPRRALQETAFFFPHLKTDENGNIKIQFTTPESLTEWKFMAMAHTPSMQTGYFETKVRTQKDLMVVPNPPRFLREGDQITFSTKINNLSEKSLSGKAQLLLFDAFTMQPIDVEFGNAQNQKSFQINAGSNAEISWKLSIPKNYQAIVYRVVASAGDFSDGEENTLPILTNRILVTETMPLHIREGQNKTFNFEKLQNNNSSTLDHFKLTFEMTTNPIWYAIFSLPYLREYPYECSEQVFSRLYGNVISQHIINSNPKIKSVFDHWNQSGQLKSKLEVNEELKSILLEETPWVRDAQSESEQMKRIAVLFELNQMQNEFAQTFDKLSSKQKSDGGFPWFEGGKSNVYITTHIVTGFGKLKKMGIDFKKFSSQPNSLIEKSLQFIDQEMQKEFDIYKKNNKLKPNFYQGLNYLYAKSFHTRETVPSKKFDEIKKYFLDEIIKDKSENLQTQALKAIVLYRYNKKDEAKQILHSLKERAVTSDEMGMYWKNNISGWFWHEAPIETQALLIEAFDEITSDIESIESMKVWLLKNRQTNQWNSTKSTTEAVYALMNTGKDWTNAEDGITVKIGNEIIDLKSQENNPQVGSGYVKMAWDKQEIKPELGKVEINKTSPGVAWGALYWQYFEDLDKITSAETGIKFNKQLFVKKNSANGPILTKITENTPIQIGDVVTVRLEIKIDRNMEFVHLKDMRASGFEPVNVFSQYKFQGGIGYYESTRDAATNFFIDYMPKGTYVFEYDVRANNKGNFSNGVTSLQNMYAPEMSAHSEGIRVQIK